MQPSVAEANLTFLVPFYKGKDYLRRTLASVRAQTVACWRLVVVDDCGPETGVAELVAGFREPRFQYEKNARNLGLAGNWNRCLELAATPLFTLLHADDELLPRYVETMLAAAQAYPEAAAFFCNARIIGADSNPVFSFPDAYKRILAPPRAGVRTLAGEGGVAALLRGNFIMCPTLCYVGRRVEGLRFRTDRQMVPDLDFTTRLLLSGQTLVGLPEVAYAYRRHAENATVQHTATLRRFEEEVDLYDELNRIASARDWRQAAAIARKKTIIKLNLLYCALLDTLRLRPRAALNKTGLLLRLMRATTP